MVLQLIQLIITGRKAEMWILRGFKCSPALDENEKQEKESTDGVCFPILREAESAGVLGDHWTPGSIPAQR